MMQMPQDVPAMPIVIPAMPMAMPVAMPMFGPMMGGRPVTNNIQNLGRAANAITQFNPGKKFWTPPRDLSAATEKGAGKVSKRLGELAETGMIDFTGVRVPAATLKEYNTQINTVLQFVQAHGASLPINQGQAIHAHMLTTKSTLAMECIRRLNAGATPEDAKQLCALLNQLLPDLPFDTQIPQVVQGWKAMNQYIHDLATNPDLPNHQELARLLGPSLKQCRANMVQINKAEALAFPAIGSHERTVEQVSKLQERQGKMRLEGGEIGMVAQERHTSRWATLKAKIAEFFGRVGRSSESQAAAEVLVNDVHQAHEQISRESEDPQLTFDEAYAFFRDVIEPLSTNKWFQGALKHNPTIRQTFEDTAATVMSRLAEQTLLKMEELINVSAPVDALRHLKDLVADLKKCGLDKGRCDTLMSVVTQRQQEITTDRLTQIAVDSVATRGLEELAQLEEAISDLRAASGADVFKECRRAETQALNAISNRRTEIGNQEVGLLAAVIPSARSDEGLRPIQQGLERIINNPTYSPETKQLARQRLREVEARAQSLRSYGESQAFLSHDLFNADGALIDPAGFLHHLENCVNFLTQEPELDLVQHDDLAIGRYAALVQQANTAQIGIQLGRNGYNRLRDIGVQCQDLQTRVHPE